MSVVNIILTDRNMALWVRKGTIGRFVVCLSYPTPAPVRLISVLILDMSKLRWRMMSLGLLA